MHSEETYQELDTLANRYAAIAEDRTCRKEWWAIIRKVAGLSPHLAVYFARQVQTVSTVDAQVLTVLYNRLGKVEEEIEQAKAAEQAQTRATGVDDVWGEDPEYPRKDWQYEVGNGDTNLGYWEWAAHEKEIAAEDHDVNDSRLIDESVAEGGEAMPAEEYFRRREAEPELPPARWLGRYRIVSDSETIGEGSHDVVAADRLTASRLLIEWVHANDTRADSRIDYIVTIYSLEPVEA